MQRKSKDPYIWQEKQCIYADTFSLCAHQVFLLLPLTLSAADRAIRRTVQLLNAFGIQKPTLIATLSTPFTGSQKMKSEHTFCS